MPSAAELSVLVVDDQSSMRGLTKAHLRELGVQKIYDAPSGNSALKMLDGGPVDLIISDWVMEDGDGLAFLTALRRRPDLKHIPFIMATVQGEMEQVHAAVNAGVNGYLLKPFDTGMLLKKMQRIFGPLAVEHSS